MKKIVLFGLIGVMSATSANAGWFSDLFKKDAEPQTLSEACNSDEITAVCPDILLGDQTLAGCLGDNIKSLSKKCAKYVKKSIKENKDLVLEQKDSATNAVSEQVQTVKDAVAEKKNDVSNMKQAAKDKKAQIKSNAKAVGKEFKDAAVAVKNDAVETGKSFKEIVK